jgi:hypothetical protein
VKDITTSKSVSRKNCPWLRKTGPYLPWHNYLLFLEVFFFIPDSWNKFDLDKIGGRKSGLILEAWSSFRGFFPGGRSTRLRPAEGLAAAPGGAAAVIQIIKEVNIAQKKQGEADQGAYPREAENEAQELGSQKSE